MVDISLCILSAILMLLDGGLGILCSSLAGGSAVSRPLYVKRSAYCPALVGLKSATALEFGTHPSVWFLCIAWVAATMSVQNKFSRLQQKRLSVYSGSACSVTRSVFHSGLMLHESLTSMLKTTQSVYGGMSPQAEGRFSIVSSYELLTLSLITRGLHKAVDYNDSTKKCYLCLIKSQVTVINVPLLLHVVMIICFCFCCAMFLLSVCVLDLCLEVIWFIYPLTLILIDGGKALFIGPLLLNVECMCYTLSSFIDRLHCLVVALLAASQVTVNWVILNWYIHSSYLPDINKDLVS
ncbi:hypothetical protein MIR68_010119 [Amoeboaphelidium protococcarum]|nr:hypothetical protein MIR68_010119 [Amoeboaphelidium protococcarum]